MRNAICIVCNKYGLVYDPSYPQPKKLDRIERFVCQDCGCKVIYDSYRHTWDVYDKGLRNIKNSHKSVLCRLPIAGCLDDGTIPCYTGCSDGNGRPEIVSINEKYIEKIIDNKD